MSLIKNKYNENEPYLCNSEDEYKLHVGRKSRLQVTCPPHSKNRSPNPLPLHYLSFLKMNKNTK